MEQKIIIRISGIIEKTRTNFAVNEKRREKKPNKCVI